MTTVVSFLELLFLPVKDDAVGSLSPDPLLLLHYFLGLYFDRLALLLFALVKLLRGVRADGHAV